jgi:sugar lactone lactonase YvrE
MSAVAPNTATRTGAASAAVNITLHIPSPTAQAHARRPQFVSPSTLGIGVNVGPASTTFTLAQQTTPLQAIDVSVASSACTPAAGGTRTCTISVSAPPGNDAIAITAWDASPASGSFSGAHMLSTQTLTQSVLAGKQNTLNFVLNGITASVAFAPIGAQSHVLSTAGATSIVGMAIASFSLSALDADGNTIVGPGAPTLAVTSPDNKLRVANAGNTWTVQPLHPNPQALTITATFADGSASQTFSQTVGVTQELWAALSENVTEAVGYALTSSGPQLLDTIPSNDNLFSLAVDPASGNVWLGDETADTVSAFSAPTASGGPNALATATIGFGTGANQFPLGIAFDASNRLWITDFDDFYAVETVAGAAAPSALTNSPFAVTSGTTPAAVAFDRFATAWIANAGTNTVTAFNANPSGSPSQQFSGATLNLASVGVQFTSPQALAFDAAGHLWLGDGAGNVQEFTAPGQSAPVSAPTAVSGAALAFASDQIGGLSFDAAGNLWVGRNSGVIAAFTPHGTSAPVAVSGESVTVPLSGLVSEIAITPQ